MPDKPLPLTASRFAQLMQALKLDFTYKKFAVAVSGGADSMALALLLAEWGKQNGKHVTALIFDHRIRPESTKEAEQVKKILKAQGIKAEILTTPERIGKRNLQAEARKYRYAALADYCREKQCRYLFTAHHADDQLETMLMRLARGSGLEGLSGIAPVSAMGNITLIRPLLSVSKEELIATLNARKCSWMEDPSNYSAAYARNRMRKVTSLLKEEGLTANRIATTATHLQSALGFIREEVTRFLQDQIHFSPAGYASFDATAFANANSEITFRALKRIVAYVTGNEDPLRAESLLPLHENLRTGLEKSATVAGIQFYPHPKAGLIYCLRELKNTGEDISISHNKTIIWDDRFIGQSSKIPHKPLRIGCLEAAGVAALPAEILRRKEIKDLPRRVLATFPAIRGVEALLAVPHIGYWVDTGLSETLRIEYAPLKRLAASHRDSITNDVES